MSYQSLSNSLYNPSSTVGTSGTSLTLSDTTQSTSTETGALIVSGGSGIAKNLYVGGNIVATGTVTSGGGGSGLTRLSYLSSVGSSTSVTFDNTVITASYKRIEIVFQGISADATATLRMRLSGDNGSTPSSYFTIRSSQAASSQNRGRLTIDNCDSASANREVCSDLDEDGNIICGNINVTSGVIDWLELSPSTGNFDGGTVSIYGWN